MGNHMRGYHKAHYTFSGKTLVERAIDEKMKVLEEFYIVNDHNEKTIRDRLTAAVKAEPDKDYDVVLDRVAKKFIEEKFNSLH